MGGAMFTLIALFQVASAQPLNLTCMGGGTANKVTVSNVYGSNNGSGMVGTTPYSYSGSSTAVACRRLARW